MRDLAINKQTIYYANPTGVETKRYDSYGNETGSPIIEYETPKQLRVNVSAGNGSSTFQPYGVSQSSSKRIVSSEILPLNAETHLWVGIAATATVGEVTTVLPHNYVVDSIEKTVNTFAYGIKEVTIS